MGVRRLFSRGGQKFSRGARTYFLPKKQRKRYYFPKKSRNRLFLAGLGRPGGGQEPPLALPSGRPWPLCIKTLFLGLFIHVWCTLHEPNVFCPNVLKQNYIKIVDNFFRPILSLIRFLSLFNAYTFPFFLYHRKK